MVRAARISLLAVVVAWPAVPAAADDRFTLGARLDVVGADGEPANDILGAGVFVRYRLAERWSLGVALDHSPEFDVERPYELLGLVGEPAAGEVDASGTLTALTVSIERHSSRPGKRLGWYWTLGAGVAAVDVDDVTGPLAGGGVYDITQDVGSELLLGGGVGLTVRLGGSWSLDCALRADRHFTDWTVTDRVSGRRAEYDDYLVRGVTLGLGYSF